MADDSDVGQARIFLAALDREIDAVSVKLEEARRFTAKSPNHGMGSSGIGRDEKLLELRRTLTELHRQSANLRARFSLDTT